MLPRERRYQEASAVVGGVQFLRRAVRIACLRAIRRSAIALNRYAATVNLDRKAGLLALKIEKIDAEANHQRYEHADDAIQVDRLMQMPSG
jgi:hypothetical protein